MGVTPRRFETMAIDASRDAAGGGSITSRLIRARAVLIVAAIVFVGLFAAGALGAWHGLAAWCVIAAAAVIAQTSETSVVAVSERRDDVATAERAVGAAIAGIPDPVFVVDRQGIIVGYNDKAHTIAPAITRNQPLSLGWRVPDVLEAVKRVAAGGDVERVEFAERVPADRSSEAFVAPLNLTEPRRTLVLITVHDLTPIRRVEEMRADFVANASHELRTPLASLSGFIDTLQGPARNDPDARERFLGIMKQQATRMARLIDDLLSLSRIELRSHQLPQTEVDLVAIVRQVADSLQMMARERDVAVALDLPAEPLTIRGDRDELLRVFENLIENAIKYGATGKRIEVTGRRDQTAEGNLEAVISVRDFGPGIAPEHLPRLTERFYRVDVVESRALGGTGLGLALAKHILIRHRGRLAIDSMPGQGATFTVRIPLAANGK
jgi:two-component system phosphate regulon sensor histidine kinase PhoR